MGVHRIYEPRDGNPYSKKKGFISCLSMGIIRNFGASVCPKPSILDEP